MKKIYTFYFIIILTGFVFIARLFYLQIYSYKYTLNAYNASIRQEIILPERGVIFDRNGKLLVSNQYYYDVMITPIEMGNLDEFDVEGFCKLVEVEKDFFYDQVKKAKAYSFYLPSVFRSSLPKEKIAFIQEKIFFYKGCDIVKRSLRDYKVKSGAHILGYTGEVSLKQIKKNPETYQMGDFIGEYALEKYYEETLRGKKGIKYWIRDRWGRSIDLYNEGKNNIKAVNGKELTLTIDWNLQEYAEKLMYEKKGALVAIDPKSGEILSLISSPSIDPNVFVGQKRAENYLQLVKDLNKPLFNRVTQGIYPPASSFKILNGLIGLELGVISPSSRFVCHGEFTYGNKKIKCGCGAFGDYRNIESAIATSCNTYFAFVYKKSIEKFLDAAKGLDNWASMAISFGFGNTLEFDLYNRSGEIPTSTFYDVKYGKKRWNALTTISNSIGQGEVGVTPLQLANMMAIIANRGFYYLPHLVKKIKKSTFQKIDDVIMAEEFHKPKQVKIDPSYFNPIIKGMEKVFEIGTGRFFRSFDLKMAAKSGTAQNFINLNRKLIVLEDHSIFTMFAPVEDPKIAIAVIIENGGFGSRWAGPIAVLLAEKYIKGEVSRGYLEEKMMNFGLKNIYTKINNLIKNASIKRNVSAK